ncbi:MAG: alpha/beta fold hydrolase [Rhodospirillales bacterium]|nr:alpha/beta fold hydrolase [Rhodospirillales bacterium]
MEEHIKFDSDGFMLDGVLHIPDDYKAGEKRTAWLVLHGFGGSKNGGGTKMQAEMMCKWGYVTLRFDHRGCGDSEGERGYIRCLDQVADVQNALTWLAKRDEVDEGRIGCTGGSFGAAVTVYTAGIDKRIGAAISIGGWGDGERKFRGQHPTPEAWKKFTDMLEAGKKHREETGTELMVPRWDIVPIPEHLRKNVNPDANMEFPAETAQSMFDFKADDVVGNIAPRPLLLLHSANDSVTPTEQSVEMFKRAGKPTDLVLLSDVDHFPFSDETGRFVEALKGWLDVYFPATVS